MLSEINDRQEGLVPDQSQKHIFIAGAGGIGGHVALQAALVGYGVISIADNDVLESSNLNRTLFRTSDIGRLKVDAIKELILERRPMCDVFTYNALAQSEQWKDADMIIDCTDKLFLKKEMKEHRPEKPYLKLGYDGDEVTFDLNDFASGMWGGADGYAVVPSYLIPPNIIASLAIHYLTFGDMTKSFTKTFKIQEIVSQWLNGNQG